MVRLHKQPLSAGRVIRPVIMVCAVFYLGYSALHGERGLYALFRERQELSMLNQQFTKTKAEREHVELRVSHLRDGSLDLDLLDEQMRRMLGMTKKGEVVVLSANETPAN